MTELFDGLFVLPYEHSRWLADQQKLIDRMKSLEGETIERKTKALEEMQKHNQCSIIMIEQLQDIFKDFKKESLTTESECDISIDTM